MRFQQSAGAKRKLYMNYREESDDTNAPSLDDKMNCINSLTPQSLFSLRASFREIAAVKDDSYSVKE